MFDLSDQKGSKLNWNFSQPLSNPSLPSNISPGPRIDQLRKLPPAKIKIDENPIVGENLFLTNTFPIRKNDNLAMKALKGTGNALISTLTAPSELLRRGSIQGGSLLSGNGLQNLPKNTTFTGDILPKGASNALSNLRQNRPIIGGLATAGLETIADPTLYMGTRAVNNFFNPEEIGRLKPVELPKKTAPDPQEQQALADIQNAYKQPTLRDIRQQQLTETFNNKPINANIENPLSFKPIQQAIEENVARPSSNRLGQKDYEELFGSPIRKYNYQTGKQKMYEDIFSGAAKADDPAKYFGKATKEDVEAAFGKPVNKYALTPQQQAEYNRLFSGDDVYFSPKREAAKANADARMRFGQTQEDVEAAFKPPKTYKAESDSRIVTKEITARMEQRVKDIEASIKQADKQSPVESILKKIKDMGGIRQANDGIFEERRAIPTWVKNNTTGRPLDEVADTLGMTSDELLAAIAPTSKTKSYAREAQRIADSDPEYQALGKLLDDISPNRKTLKVQRVPIRPTQQQRNNPKVNPSDLRLQSRDLTNSRIGKPYPFAQRTTTISETSRPNVKLKRTVQPGQKIEPPKPIEPTLREPIPKPERLTWTNKDATPGISGLNPLKSVTKNNLGKLPKPQKVFWKDVNKELHSKGQQPPISAELMKKEIKSGKLDISKLSNKEEIRKMLGMDLQRFTAPPREIKEPRIVSSLKKEKLPKMEKLHNLYRETVNNTHGINRTVKGTGLTGSDNAVVMASNSRNASGTVDHIVNNGLVDMSGKTVVNKSITGAFKLPKGQEEAFDMYLYHLHNIDRMKEGKPVFNSTIGISESRKAIAELENSYPLFKEKGAIIRETLDELLNKWGVDSGLITPELRNLLKGMYRNYVPTYRNLDGADAIAKKSRSAGVAKIINKAVGGEEDLIKLSESIPMLISKTVKAARKNEVYQGILEATRVNPDNGFARILKADLADEADTITNAVKADGIEGLITNSENALQADAKLGYLLTVMEKGKPVKLQIKKDLFESLEALNKVDDTALNSALQTVKKYATNPFKALITGYNPLFAIRNVARDIPTAYIQGTENNPLKFAKNLGTATKEMLTKSPRYKEFQALGGQGSNFFNIEQGLRPKGKLQKIGNKVAALNNFTETLPRYGEYIGTLKRGGEDYSNKMQALYNAAEVTTNFGRHGDIIKSIDAVVPYLNPAFQGIDRSTRALLKPSTYAKALGVITVPTAGVYAINQTVDKENYDKLDNRTKDTYFVIPEKLWGGAEGKFLKIAKTREAGVLFGTLFERLARLVQGKEKSFKGFPNTVATNMLPVNPFESNIASPILNAKYTNKDFANRDIVPAYMLNDKRSPRYQYDDRTSEIAKKLGDKLNLSPIQIDYLIDSYTGIVGDLALPANTKTARPMDVLSRNFIADTKYNNEIQSDFYNKLDDLRRIATDRNISENIPSKKVTREEKDYNAMLKISKQMAELRKAQRKAQASGNREKVEMYQQKILDTASKAKK